MKSAVHYRVTIDWLEEEECFVASAPEFDQCTADGETREEALKALEELAAEYLRSPYIA